MLFVIIFLLSLAVSFLVPVWWIIAPLAFLVALFFAKKGRSAFFSGFLACMLAWTIPIFLKTAPNQNIMAGKMASLFQLPNWFVLVLVTIMLAGMLGGLSALIGFMVKKAVTTK